jgi:hypothetical protein
VCGSASVELVLPPATSPPNAAAIAAALAIAPSRVSDLKTSTASGGGTAISFVVVPTLVSAGLNTGDILGLLAVNSDAQLDTLAVSRITGSWLLKRCSSVAQALLKRRSSVAQALLKRCSSVAEPVLSRCSCFGHALFMLCSCFAQALLNRCLSFAHALLSAHALLMLCSCSAHALLMLCSSSAATRIVAWQHSGLHTLN